VGSGGKSTNDFIKEVILSELGNEILDNLGDASYLAINTEIAFSTDSFVVKPEFFNGGDIGKLAIYGTCNDLAVSGATPKYLSLSFIIPEGYEIDKFKKIISSIKSAVNEVGIKIVTGDTKVIESDELAGLIINTAGIGNINKKLNIYENIKVNDDIIFTSDIARHGISVMIARENLNVNTEIISDCGNLYEIFHKIGYNDISFARDATRGGVAAVLYEIMEKTGLGFEIEEEKLPLEEKVKYFCEMFGFDPLSIANEGLAILIVDKEKSKEILYNIKKTKIGKGAEIVGKVINDKKIFLKTEIGGKRFIEMPRGKILPRIC
jgi:hydrogenase expression/formation protein HypE